MTELRSGAGALRRIAVPGLVVAAALWSTTAAAPAQDVVVGKDACAGATVVPTNPAMRQAAANAVLCLVNAERAQRALPAVLSSSQLTKAASFHAGDMVRRHYFSHITPSGQGVRSRVARTGYLRGARSPALAEAIAWGSDVFASPAQLVLELMQSPLHKAIVVDRRFRDIGVGLALGAPLEGMGPGATLSLNFGRR